MGLGAGNMTRRNLYFALFWASLFRTSIWVIVDELQKSNYLDFQTFDKLTLHSYQANIISLLVATQMILDEKSVEVKSTLACNMTWRDYKYNLQHTPRLRF